MEESNNDDVVKELCCQKMDFAVNKEKIIDYEDYMRNYNLCLSRKNRVYAIAFCPWCGKNLGKELNHEYYTILYQEYGIELPETTEQDKVPQEFKSEEWWRKRGL